MLALLGVGDLWYRQGTVITTSRSQKGSPKFSPIA
jgi:hypothetical protein